MRTVSRIATFMFILSMCAMLPMASHAFPDTAAQIQKQYDTFMKEARALENMGMVPEAIEKYNKASEIMPERAEPWAKLSTLYLILKDPLMAINAADVAVMLEPANKSVWLNKSTLELYAGRHDMALITTRDALEVFPDDLDLMNNLATAQIYAGAYGDADRTLKQILKLSPNNATVLYNLACVHSLMKKKLSAIEYLKKAVSIDPSYKAKAVRDSDLQNIRNLGAFREITQ